MIPWRKNASGLEFCVMERAEEEREAGREEGREGKGGKDFARPPLVYSQTNFNIGFRAHLGC